MVSLAAPSPGETVSGIVLVTASAADDASVARVEFFVAGVLACTDTTAPYSCAWSVPRGKGKTYDLVAEALDAAGNVRSSAVVRVTSY